MKTLTSSIVTLAAVLSLSLFLAGCSTKSADFRAYSAPASESVTTDNAVINGAGFTDPTRGMGISDNDDHSDGVFGPTNSERGMGSYK